MLGVVEIGKQVLRALGGGPAHVAQDDLEGHLTKGLGTGERKLPALPSWAILPQSTETAAPRVEKPRKKRFPEVTRERVLAWQARCSERPAKHPVQMHAHQLLLWINDPASNSNLDHPGISRGMRERGIFSDELEDSYYTMIGEAYHWELEHPWRGTNGIAQHFRKLLGREKKGYRYTIVDGVERRLCFFPIPEPAPASGHGRAKPTPEPTPKRKRKRKAKATGTVIKMADRRRAA